MKILIKSCFLIFLLSSCLNASTYKIAEDKSSVSFQITHFGQGVVKGKFTKINGIIVYDPNNISKSSFSGEIPIIKLNTGNRVRDSHLKKNKGFFNTQRFPNIQFKSNAVSVDPNNSNQLLVNGTLTIKDISQSIIVPIKVQNHPSKNNQLLINGTLDINRHKFNIKKHRRTILPTANVIIDIVAKPV